MAMEMHFPKFYFFFKLVSVYDDEDKQGNN